MTDNTPSTYQCPNCHNDHKIAMYATAQMAMGHTVQHHCACGWINELEDGLVIHSATRVCG